MEVTLEGQANSLPTHPRPTILLTLLVSSTLVERLTTPEPHTTPPPTPIRWSPLPLPRARSPQCQPTPEHISCPATDQRHQGTWAMPTGTTATRRCSHTWCSVVAPAQLASTRSNAAASERPPLCRDYALYSMQWSAVPRRSDAPCDAHCHAAMQLARPFYIFQSEARIYRSLHLIGK